jgi:hypothetical protein
MWGAHGIGCGRAGCFWLCGRRRTARTRRCIWRWNRARRRIAWKLRQWRASPCLPSLSNRPRVLRPLGVHRVRRMHVRLVRQNWIRKGGGNVCSGLRILGVVRLGGYLLRVRKPNRIARRPRFHALPLAARRKPGSAGRGLPSCPRRNGRPELWSRPLRSRMHMSLRKRLLVRGVTVARRTAAASFTADRS